jgi:O-antigen/teichoic acid export membrane protein
MTGTSSSGHLSGDRLSRNMLWSFLAQGVPLVVGLATVPELIDRLDVSRFGILTLSWVIVGYFSLFDLGFGRAMTHLVARAISQGSEGDIPSIFGTTTLFMVLLGVIIAAIAWISAPTLVQSIFNIEPELHSEALGAFYLLSLSIPVVILSTAAIGLLEAKQRFDLTLIVRLPLGVTNYLGPLLVIVFFVNDLVAVLALLIIARVLALAAYLFCCASVYPGLLRSLRFDKNIVSQLLQFGIWMTVANTIAPLLLYADRFMIGILHSMAAVAYYSTPFDIVYRLVIVPNALVAVLFPAFSSLSVYDQAKTSVLFGSGVKAIYLVVFLMVYPIIVLAEDGLSLWLGPEFANHSTVVLQVLAFGILVNSIARVANTLIQGSGRPDISAKWLMLQLPAYIAVLWFFLQWFGILGAALAWLLRALADILVVFWYAQSFLSIQLKDSLRQISLLAGISIILPLCGIQISSAGDKLIYLLLTASLFLVLAWHYILSPEERFNLQKKLFRQQS